MSRSVRMLHIFNILFCPPLAQGRTGIAILCLRIFVGTAFIFHGGGKTAELEAFAAEFNIPVAMATAAAYSQLAAAFFLIAGFLTPLGASLIAGTMSVATFKLIARGESFVTPGGHSWEASAFYLTASFVIFSIGPGLYSLDALLMRRTPLRGNDT